MVRWEGIPSPWLGAWHLRDCVLLLWLYLRLVSEVIYICGKYLWLPNGTPFLFGVEMCSAENSISQPLLKGEVVPRCDPSPGDVSWSPRWGFPIGCLLGVRISWCTHLTLHIPLFFLAWCWRWGSCLVTPPWQGGRRIIGNIEGAWLPEVLVCSSQTFCYGRKRNLYLIQPLQGFFCCSQGNAVLANRKVDSGLADTRPWLHARCWRP